MDFLDSCDKTPLICLQFPDDIYLIWHEVISKMNRFHDTIKFTINYTDFLGVNIKMNKMCYIIKSTIQIRSAFLKQVSSGIFRLEYLLFSNLIDYAYHVS